jgi:magnesium transporter
MTRKLAIFLRPGILITIHRAPVPFIEDLKLKSEDMNGKYKNTNQLLCRILKEIFRSYEDDVVKSSRDLEFYEGKILQNHQLPPFLKGLFQVRRRSSVIRKVLLLSRTLLDALRDMELSPSQVQDTKDMFIRVETLSEDLYERSASLITMHLALADQRANQVMKVLTIFSAFFLPITFIAGVYGMNFDYMPELNTRYGYFATLGLMGMVSLGIYLWFKRAGWL